MKNYDETRQKLKEMGWRRYDRSFHGIHEELWYAPANLRGRSTFSAGISYQSACRKSGIAPAASPHRHDPKPAYKRDKTIQSKHLDTRRILQFIVDHCRKTGHLWCTFYDLEAEFPDWDKFPDGVRRAKLKSLVKMGYLDGCNCGCRGDFEPQRAAYDYLGTNRSRDNIASGHKMTLEGRATRDLWWEGTTMCVQFDDTGEIAKFQGARMTSYSMGASFLPVDPLGSLEVRPLAPMISMKATMTYKPVLEFIPITFTISDENKP